jgi:hypothetical protein
MNDLPPRRRATRASLPQFHRARNMALARGTAIAFCLGFLLAQCGDGGGKEVAPEVPGSPASMLGEAPQPKRVFQLPVLGFKPFNKGLPTSGTWIGYPLLADFNRDGRADFVASNREEDGYHVYEAGDQGWTQRFKDISRDLGYGPAIAGDVNGDAISDLVVSAHLDGVRAYRNDGAMLWSLVEPRVPHHELQLDIAFIDLDGDAHKDLVGIGHFKGGLNLWRGKGDGTYEQVADAKIPECGYMGRDVETGDLDGDGRDDILVGGNAGLKVLLRRGEGTAFEDVSKNLPVPSIGNTIYSVAILRLKPDGPAHVASAGLSDPDPRATTKHETFGIWRLDAEKQEWIHVDKGSGPGALSNGPSRTQNHRALCFADLDRDGMQDMVLMTLEEGASVWLGDGEGSFRAVGRLDGLIGKNRVVAGDVNSDGWMDLGVTVPAGKDNPEDGGLRVFLNGEFVWKQ